MYYVDPWGKQLGFEDVFTKIDMCRAHFDRGRAWGRTMSTVHPLSRAWVLAGPVSPAAMSWSRGGTSGIGAAIAAAFLAGALPCTATGATDAEVAAARELLPGPCGLQLDVRDGPAVRRRCRRLRAPRHLVNCAGIIRRGDELRARQYSPQVVDVNLNGTMRVCARRAAAARRQPAAPSSTPPRC